MSEIGELEMQEVRSRRPESWKCKRSEIGDRRSEICQSDLRTNSECLQGDGQTRESK